MIFNHKFNDEPPILNYNPNRIKYGLEGTRINYIKLGGMINKMYMYFDLNVDSGYLADSLFYKRKIPVRFKEEMTREGDKYRAIFCTVRKKYQKEFEEALEELKIKMCLFGNNDYEEYCDSVMKQLISA
jgi:hypothetical protein